MAKTHLERWDEARRKPGYEEHPLDELVERHVIAQDVLSPNKSDS